MMDRRQFLFRSLLATTGAALVPPSQLWPFRKIFVPSVVPAIIPTPEAIRAYSLDTLLEWDALTGVYVIKGDHLEILYKTMLAGLGRKR